jgi:aryl-alcohol dehydrogenase-like predicted oxidoreductase
MTTNLNTTPRQYLLGGELSINRIGLGAMRLTGQPGNFGPYADWEAGKALIRHAVELGVNFIDTAHAYGPVHNERLIGEALASTQGVVIGTKGGIEKYSPTQLKRDASPAALRRHVETSLKALGVERLDLFQLHWIDPATPLEASLQALAELRQEGKLRLIGLSNIDRAQLEAALAITPIASVQNRFNFLEREHDALIDFTASRGIAFIPYGPLGAHPMQRGAPLAEGRHGDAGTPAQQALRWLLDRSPNVVVIPGTTSLLHLQDNVAAWDVPAAT